jgi:hypothetical protein
MRQYCFPAGSPICITFSRSAPPFRLEYQLPGASQLHQSPSPASCGFAGASRHLASFGIVLLYTKIARHAIRRHWRRKALLLENCRSRRCGSLLSFTCSRLGGISGMELSWPCAKAIRCWVEGSISSAVPVRCAAGAAGATPNPP